MDPSRQPYQRAIDKLNSLQTISISKSPIKKLNIFGEMTKIVKEEIADFWKGVNVAPDKLTYDADQILMIYVYIIAKSKLRNLFAHLHMCQEFSTNYVMTTRVGYCYTTMEIALTMLLENSDLIDMTALYD